MVLKNFSKFAIKKAVLFFMAIMVVSLVLVGCDKKVKVESVTVSKQTISLDLGQEETVKATVLPENATDKTVTWSSSDTSVATVSNGKIVAVGSGTATITATAGEKTATVSVTVKAIKYTFSFTVNGGSPVAAQEVESGKKATKPTDPQREGYSFGGWYNDSKFITPYNFDTPVTDDVVVYAKWVANKFVVKFDVDGGVAIPDLQIEYNNSVTKPANPVKEGYTFINWFKDAEKTDTFDFATEKITQAITIYAKFEINKYTVKFNTNGGSSIADQIIEHGQKVTKPADPTKEGFLFKGWFVNDVEFSFDNVVTSAVTVVAKWEEDPNFKLITFNMNGGSWNINSIAKFLSGNPVKTTPLAGQYNVTNATYLEVYKTSIFINDSKKQFTPSKWVTRVVVALNAKGFYEVSKVIAAGTDATDADLAGAYVLFAHEDYKVGEPFLKGLTVGQIVSFTGFDITTAAIGAVEGSLNIYEAAQGVSATQALVATGSGLPVPSKANHKFVGWYTTADFSGDPVTAVSANATVYAKFEADLVDVIFDSKGGSAVETGKVLYNQKLTQPADPTKIGYTFGGWFTDAELTKQYDFNTLVTSAFTLYAKWEAVLQDVTYVTNGAAEIAAQQVPFDGKITKPAEPTKEGFVFLGWFTEAEFTNLYDFNALVKGPVTLHAKWAAKKDIVVDYTAMYNETLKAYYIKIEVSGELLDVASIKAISQVRLAGDFVVAVELTPDTDTALWFKVAAENANPNLKKAGLYTYVITKQDDSVYAIEFDYKPESVTDLPFEVIFSMNGGDAVASQIIKKDEKATQPADPTYKGYTFKGWFADSKLETEFDFNTPITAITTVYAKWEIIEYTITYTTNGGTIRYKNVNEMLVDFLKDFHTFVQSTDSLEVFMHGEGKTSGFAGTWANEATKAKIFEGPRPTEVNNAFFASSEAYMEKWLPFFDLIQKYVVAVNPAQNFWGDTYVGLIRLGNFIQNTRPAYQNWAPQGWVGPEKYVVTSDTFEMPIPTKANYDFVGWYTTADFKGEVVTKVEKGSTGNLVLHAKYVAKQYTLTYDTNGGQLFLFANKNEMITALLTDLYDFVKPAESLSDFMHGTGKTSGFNGLWTTNATYKAKIYAGPRPTEVNEALFISSSKYMNKWLPFFDMIDKFTNTVNNTQNFYASGTYTGFLRLTSYITSTKPSAQVSDETMNMMPEEFTLVNKFTVETTKVKLVSATKPGCVFLGWYLTPDFSGERLTEITGALAKNVILYAKWDESGAAKVEFETDGGSEVGHVTVPKGGQISKPADPVKEGHRFLGWYTEAELTNVFSFDTALNENIKLYAKWEKIEYVTVEFESNEGSAVAPITVEKGQKITIPADPVKEAHRFLGWFTDAELTQEFSAETAINENIKLYAKWLLAPSNITISGADKVSVGKTATYTVDSTAFKFIWSVSDTEIATIDENGVLTAVKFGKVNVIVKAEGFDVQFEFEVEVLGVPKSISYRGPEEFVVGGSGKVYASATAEAGEAVDSNMVSYSVDKPEILTIDPVTGIVAALTAGEANITITSTLNSAKTVSKKVTVHAADHVFNGKTILVEPAFADKEAFYSSVTYTTHVMGYNAFATLEAALEAATEGTTIVLGEMTVSTPVTVNKNKITITGKATITSAINVAANVEDLTIDGLKFSGAGQVVGDKAGGIKNFTFKNNIAKDTTLTVGAVVYFANATDESINYDFVIMNNIFDIDKAVKVEARYIQLNNLVNLQVIGNYFEGIKQMYVDAIRVNGTNDGNNTVGIGLSGIVNISENEFINIGQRSVWIRRYHSATITMFNNLVENSGDQTYGGGFQIETWYGSTASTVNVKYNTFVDIPATFAVRFNNNTNITATSPWIAVVSYNKFLANEGLTYFVDAKGTENLVDASNNFYLEAPAATKFLNVKGSDKYFLDEEAFEEAVLIDKYGALSIPYTLTNDITGFKSTTYGTINIAEEFGTWGGSGNRTQSGTSYYIGTRADDNVKFTAKEGYYIESVQIKVGSASGTPRNVKVDTVTIVSSVDKNAMVESAVVVLTNKPTTITLTPSGALFYEYVKVVVKPIQ